MDNVGYIAISHAAALARATDLTANNIANANSNGYRASRISFDQMVVSTGSEDAMGKMSYSLDRNSYLDLTAGNITPTGGQLDVAIQGDTWFGYERLDGQIALGRDGNLALTAEGQLVTTQGHAILDIGGGPIEIPADAGDVVIGTDGTITSGDGDILGQIGVFAAQGAENWKRLDGGMIVPREGGTPLEPSLDPRVIQGHVEASNVSPIIEMTRMIDQQRAYERSMNLAEASDNLRKQTLQRLGRSAT